LSFEVATFLAISPTMKLPTPIAGASRSAAAALLSASLLFSPLNDNSPLVPAPLRAASTAQARELASGSGSRVNKDPESLLRLGLPGQPKGIRDVQVKIEEAADDLTRLLLIPADQALGGAKGALKSQQSSILKAVPASSASQGAALYDSIVAKVNAASAAVSQGQATVALESLQSSLGDVSKLEESIASAYQQPVPTEATKGNLPWLKGRATVAFELKRPGGKFDVDGTLYDKINLAMVIDGYTAPITGGNFVELVNSGFYNNFKIQRSDGFVVQTGDPKAEGKQEKNGFVPPGGSDVRKIPLEVFVRGDKAPMYGVTFDDDGRGGYASALPFNAYGALGMAREEYDADSASSQWFWLLFDSDLTPAGKNLLDGRYACFGYTTEGARLLSDVKEGDLIVSAKVTAGLDNLQNVQKPALAALAPQ